MMKKVSKVEKKVGVTVGGDSRSIGHGFGSHGNGSAPIPRIVVDVSLLLGNDPLLSSGGNGSMIGRRGKENEEGKREERKAKHGFYLI